MADDVAAEETEDPGGAINLDATFYTLDGPEVTLKQPILGLQHAVYIVPHLDEDGEVVVEMDIYGFTQDEVANLLDDLGRGIRAGEITNEVVHDG